MHFSSVPKSQSGNILIYLLVGILILVSGVFYLGRRTTPNVSISPTANYQTVKPITSENEQTIKIPLPTKWLKYQPSCHSLADNVEIYYPDNWLPKEYGNISDAVVSDAQECQVMFGYPVQPQGYQAPTPGELAWFKVQSFVDENESLTERVEKMSNQSPKAKSVTNITVNGITWSKIDYDHYATWVTTKIGNRFFEIYLINNRTYIGDNLDKLVILNNTDTLNDQIINKIKILKH